MSYHYSGPELGFSMGPHGDLLLDFPYVGPPHRSR